MIGLQTRVHAALDWSEAALRLAVSEPAGLDLSALEAPAEKIVAEVAIFLREVSECPVADLRLRALSMARCLEPLARNPRIAAALALRPAVARDVSVGHVLLAAMGVTDSAFSACLARSLASPFAGSRERVPYRELEQDWLAALSEGRGLQSQAVRRTALVTGLDLLGANRDDLYGLTHAIAYATDFGRWALPPEVSAQSVLCFADSALANVLDADDFDLAAELVLAWPCLGSPLSPTAAFALTVMTRVEDAAGVLPSFGLQRDAITRQPEALRKDYVTAVSYHTALVMGLACSTLLRCAPGIAPPQLLAPGHRDFAANLLAALRSDTRHRQWMADAAGLAPPSLAALAPFLLDVALVRAVRVLDFAGARQHLADAVAAGIALSPLALQTAQMLARIAASADVLGPAAVA
jgi:hypothetical protein